jgi:tetratricopeptide (TPR) repeat protein
MLRQVGPNHESTIDALAIWSAALSRLGRSAEAEQASKEALEQAREMFPGGGPNLWVPLVARAAVLNGQKRSKDAEAPARESLALVPSTNAKDPRRAQSSGQIGLALAGQKRFAEAIQALEGSERVFLELPGWGPKHPDTIQVHEALELARARRTLP